MPWFRVDDTLATHPKARAAGLPAMGLWAVSGAYCMQHLTEGRVPGWFVATWPNGKKLARQLVKAGLWYEVGEDWQFHQWDERQRTKEEVEEDRAKARDRQRRWRDERRNKNRTNAVSNGVTDGVTTDEATPLVTTPPTHPIHSSSITSETTPPRTDVEAICDLLADCVAVNIDKQPTVTQKWRDEARRLLDLDDRSQTQVEHVIRWATSDSFWKRNIQSMPKLREKYDQLLVAAREDWRKNHGATTASPDGEIDPDAVLGRDLWQPPPPPDELEPGTPAYAAWHRKQRDAHRRDRLAEAREVLERRRGA